MLRKAIKSLSQLWTPLILSKFQVFWGKVPGKVFKLDETLAPPAARWRSRARVSIQQIYKLWHTLIILGGVKMNSTNGQVLTWHEDCLQCSVCYAGISLDNVVFRDKLFCKSCYLDTYSTNVINVKR